MILELGATESVQDFTFFTFFFFFPLRKSSENTPSRSYGILYLWKTFFSCFFIERVLTDSALLNVFAHELKLLTALLLLVVDRLRR